MLPYRCGYCKSPNRIKADFWISKIDAFGFIFLSLLLTAPVWAITSLIEEYDFISILIVLITIYLAVLSKQYKIVAILAIELLIDIVLYELGLYSYSLLVATAFLITFIKVGSKIYGFFFLCVNYKFNFELICKKCGKVSKSLKLPAQP
ncbi:hypothetical protein J7384_19090 [Endozoicomonas sp. G2_1]|uniref:hypothetical protein n=1 Tax=Endozoicomonas sp. G2_1 TaxID=2821091 RepID=UPI001ADA04BB|nr:hypothetical protein [Endozoicomonas sp. G2_1]MBO9492461.1 hypothetical protein [Endozoicomonas sp. G2_1]